MGLFRKLVLLFTLVPLVEFILFWKLGELLGIWITVGTIIVTGIIGAWLARAQGFRTLTKYQAALAEGRIPHRELIDGILILVASAVLLTPGFLTDAAGFALLVPPVRDAVRKFLGKRIKNKIHVVGQDIKTGSKSVAEESEVISVDAEIIDEKTGAE